MINYALLFQINNHVWHLECFPLWITSNGKKKKKSLDEYENSLGRLKKNSTRIINLQVAQVKGHGRLMDPPARNSMWRFGFPNPVNYNDNELFCGGYAGLSIGQINFK